MVVFPEARIDYFISEDVPYLDLTSAVLGRRRTRRARWSTTRARTACLRAPRSCERVIARKLGLRGGCRSMRSGERVSAGESFMVAARVRLSTLHRGVESVPQHYSTTCRRWPPRRVEMVDAAHAENPRCEVLTTRKSMPGAKDLLTSCRDVRAVHSRTAWGFPKRSWCSTIT